MANTLEQFFTGQHLYSVVITPKIRAATGVLSTPAGHSAYTLITGTTAGGGATAGVLAGCAYNGRNVMEDLTPISSPRENLVAVHRDDTVILTEMMRVGQNQNLLALTFMATDSGTSQRAEYAEVIIRRGQSANATTSLKVVTVTFTALMAEYRESIRSNSKTASLQLLMVEDPAASVNPAVTFAAIS